MMALQMSICRNVSPRAPVCCAIAVPVGLRAPTVCYHFLPSEHVVRFFGTCLEANRNRRQATARTSGQIVYPWQRNLAKVYNEATTYRFLQTMATCQDRMDVHHESNACASSLNVLIRFVKPCQVTSDDFSRERAPPPVVAAIGVDTPVRQCPAKPRRPTTRRKKSAPCCPAKPRRRPTTRRKKSGAVSRASCCRRASRTQTRSFGF